MHFSIPRTEEFTSDDGSTYTGYIMYINAKFHCTVRYRQLYNLHEQLKKEYGSAVLPPFPPKKLLPLSLCQLEERRSLLEKFIQKVGQHSELANSEILNSFLLSAQVETCGEKNEECTLDIFLMNGYCINLSVNTTERSHEILEKVCRQINVPDTYVYYFYLFLARDEEDGNVTIVRKLQDFESPYISRQSLPGEHRVVLRKNYWDAAYDIELMTDRVTLNLLYVQTVAEVEHNWILYNEEMRQQLDALQAKGAKREYMEIARSLKFYGCMQFSPCTADYPFPGTRVLVSMGNYEICIRCNPDGDVPATSTDGGDYKFTYFKVTRMKCWRITTLHDRSENGNNSGPNFELSFEYLMGDSLEWVTVSSEQAILMSICLQSMVDELLLKKNGLKRKMPGDATRKQSWSYMKRDGSSQIMSSSQSSSSDGLSYCSTGSNQNTSQPPAAAANNGDSRSPSKSESAVTSMKRLSEKFSNVGIKSTSNKTSSAPTLTVPIENDAFDGIGDDDL